MNYRNIIVSGCVFLVLINIPAVPISWAAVIPDPVYRLIWGSIWRMVKITLYPMPGIQHQFSLYSLIAIILLVSFGLLARYLLLKYLP